MTSPRRRNHYLTVIAAGFAAAGLGGCALMEWGAPNRTTKAPANQTQATRLANTTKPAAPTAVATQRTPAFPAPMIDPTTMFGAAIEQPFAGTDRRANLTLNSATGLPVIQPGSGTAFEEGANVSQVSFAAQGADFDPDLSHDGTRIVFASTQHKAASDIYIKDVDSRVVTQLTSGPSQNVMPKLSPDGTRVAYASDRTGNWDLYVMPVTGGQAIQVTESAAHELHPSWSPDGQSLVFCRLGEVSGQWELWVMSVNSGATADFIGYGMFPEWCPRAGTGYNGADKLLFQKGRERGDRAFAIWTLDFKNGQAGNATEVAASPVAACINPTWSPDGEWIAFATVPLTGNWASTSDGRPSSAELWMADLNGTSRVRLTTGPALSLSPAWGTTGKLFFVSNRGKVDNIWSLDVTPAVRLATGWRKQGNTEMVNAPEEAGDR